MKKTNLILLAILFCPLFMFSQGNNWKINGNNINKPIGKVGTKNNRDVHLITNDTTRIIIDKHGYVEVQKDLRVKGALYVGDSSLAVFDDQNAQGGFGQTEEVMSTNGQMALGRKPPFTSSNPNLFVTMPAFASEYSLGVGGSHHRHKIHVQDQSGNTQYAAKIGFTNNTTGHGSVSDGFTVGLNSFLATFPGGIDEFNASLINQQEDARLLFNTSNAPRMQITSKLNGGFVGIGNYKNFLPQHLLHVHGRGETTGIQISKGELPLGTGSAVSDGFLIEISDGTGTFHTTLSNQEELGEIRFSCKDNLSNPLQTAIMFADGNIGIGDEATYNTLSPASENLDIQRNARIRTMPPAPTPNTFDVVLIDGTGVLHRGDASGLGGADNDWFNQATLTNVTTTVDDDLYTNGNVFINVPTTSFPNFNYVRFGVYQDFGDINANNINSTTSLFVNNFPHSIPLPPGGNSIAYGVHSRAVGTGCNKSINYGGHFTARNAQNNIAGHFESDCNACGTLNNYGVFASVPVDCGYAVWIDGNVTTTGSKSKLSDARFKTNINTISSAIDIIEQLNPVTFNFTSQPELSLPTGNQYGLIAQEVELVLPNVVTPEILPAKFDTLGNMTFDTIMFKGLNYEAFIPILIKGMKEQQEMIDSLYSIINTCCAGTKSAEATGNVDINSVIEITPDNTFGENTELFQNNPNPFRDYTKFTYSLGNQGQVELEITDEYGRYITTLVSELQSTGKYSVNWNTSDIAPGIYFYILKVDGLVWVKKAIRIK